MQKIVFITSWLLDKRLVVTEIKYFYFKFQLFPANIMQRSGGDCQNPTVVEQFFRSGRGRLPPNFKRPRKKSHLFKNNKTVNF